MALTLSLRSVDASGVCPGDGDAAAAAARAAAPLPLGVLLGAPLAPVAAAAT
jgi:hypothetical protein